MDEDQWLAERFEEHRVHLRAVAYRMLGSLTEADDAVQDTWLRLSRSGAGEVDNLGGWLTTIVARVCTCPTPSSAQRGSSSRRRRRCWPTRSALLCSLCSIPWPPLSGWRSCSMTCSSCPSRRSPPWSAGPPRRPGSSPAGRDAA